jgi:galactitol-specific phosphotransferase system IIB component
MCIALIGGMDRLEKHYQEAAAQAGITLEIFNKSLNNLSGKLKKADLVVIFTNKVSHQARNDAMHAAKSLGIPVIMKHACGVCTLRDCLNCCRTAQ